MRFGLCDKRVSSDVPLFCVITDNRYPTRGDVRIPCHMITYAASARAGRDQRPLFLSCRGVCHRYTNFGRGGGEGLIEEVPLPRGTSAYACAKWEPRLLEIPLAGAPAAVSSSLLTLKGGWVGQKFSPISTTDGAGEMCRPLSSTRFGFSYTKSSCYSTEEVGFRNIQ